MLLSQLNSKTALKINTCHPVAGDLICKHRFICHLHVSDSLRYHFTLVSLCLNNDPSWPQTSGLAKRGHIPSLYNLTSPSDPSSCSSWAAACPHLAESDETTTCQVHVTLMVLYEFPLTKGMGKSTGIIFLLPQQVQFRLGPYVYAPLGAIVKAPSCLRAKIPKSS